MGDDNFTATWICSTFEEKSERHLLSDDIYDKYSVECHERSIECMPKNIFMKILLRLFPTTRTSKVRFPGGKKVMYKGICYNNFSESKIVQLTNIQNYLDGSCFLMSRTVDCAKIYMPTEIFTNGNMIFKEIILDFSKNKWMLKVSGKLVDFSRLGISADFDNSEHNLNVILLIVKRLKLCTGIDAIHKKTIPTYIMPENISFSQENKILKKMRCSTCKRVLEWLTVGDACYKCRKQLNSFKNTSQENLINLEKNQINMESIQKDCTENKAVSHKRLQSELLIEPNFLEQNFKKSDLLILCKMYMVKPKHVQPKQEIADILRPVILEKEIIPSTLPSTSTEVSELVTSANTGMLDIEEDQAKNVPEISQKTVKQTRKRKSLFGKGKSKKKKTGNKWPCSICGKDASISSVGCDGCDQWFHADCLKIDSLDTLPDEWYCNNCGKD